MEGSDKKLPSFVGKYKIIGGKMQITTPSGYKVTFKEESDLNYGERRQIKRAAVRSVKINPEQAKRGVIPTITGEIGYEMQDEMLRVLLKEIITPDNKKVEGDLFETVLSWTNEADGDAVFKVIEDLQAGRKSIEGEVVESAEEKN